MRRDRARPASRRSNVTRPFKSRPPLRPSVRPLSLPRSVPCPATSVRKVSSAVVARDGENSGDSNSTPSSLTPREEGGAPGMESQPPSERATTRRAAFPSSLSFSSTWQMRGWSWLPPTQRRHRLLLASAPSVRASVHFSRARARERGRERVPAPKQSGAQVFLPVAPATCRVRHEMILILDDHFRQLRFRVGRPFMRQESIANEF